MRKAELLTPGDLYVMPWRFGSDDVDVLARTASADNLGELLQRVAARHRPVANERDIAIEVGVGLEPLCAMADATLLEQAVSNLAYNAVRHNREGGHVALIAESRRGASGEPRFRIRVLDDGPGIPADEIARLMEHGARGDAARGRDQAGQGIGLDIAKRAVEVQGFTLTRAPGAKGGPEGGHRGAGRRIAAAGGLDAAAPTHRRTPTG
jgi:signal transduction histidine kinase